MLPVIASVRRNLILKNTFTKPKLKLVIKKRSQRLSKNKSSLRCSDLVSIKFAPPAKVSMCCFCFGLAPVMMAEMVVETRVVMAIVTRFPYLAQSRMVDLPKGPLLPKDTGV